MEIQDIIKKAYLDGVIEGEIMAKSNLKFDLEGLANSYVESKVKENELLQNVSVSELKAETPADKGYKAKYCIGCLHYHPNQYSGNCNTCKNGNHRQKR